jgi:hypothetical protein
MSAPHHGTIRLEEQDKFRLVAGSTKYEEGVRRSEEPQKGNPEHPVNAFLFVWDLLSNAVTPYTAITITIIVYNG